ncbi:putative phospholipid hydroperoxide glutathione peroxidase 6 mitochondrial [Zea mays]|uniref:Putative phospholipid hydroperoxide glutathione peroxidase 6 mitochondrial n=1 Tax=Zea mays TaxID=4577 RepID=A0A1D6K2D4_MAIZE|nr:putative phospholipid hydroperoxide glutathione peroxidase 6 mitochondrial [Zea mays]
MYKDQDFEILACCVPVQPVRRAGARHERGDRPARLRSLQGQVPDSSQGRCERRGRCAHLQVSEVQQDRPHGRRHQVELRQVLGGQTGACRRAVCSDHLPTQHPEGHQEAARRELLN